MRSEPKSNSRSGFKYGAAFGATAMAAALFAMGVQWPQARAETPAIGRNLNATAPMSFADIIERVAPAVVTVNVTSKTEAGEDGPSLGDIPGFENFPFPTPGGPKGPAKKAPEVRGTGTGFFISDDGYIVTNNHVVEDATEIEVVLKDGRALKAKVIGADPQTDLAVLKVDGKGFASVFFETTAKPRVGDWVIAVGNPFGLGGTATSGIVSANGRDIGGPYTDFIQIDASINRGNSGGPTFDVYGRVVGVNTAIFSPSGGSVGIGFMIPSDTAAKVTQQLIERGRVTRGWLGVVIQDVTPEIAKSLGLDEPKGAIVASVTPDGPAAKGGLRAGDIVVRLNGQTVDGSRDLTRMVGEARAGDPLKLELYRDGKHTTVSVKSGDRPAEAKLAALSGGSAPEKPSDNSAQISDLGVRLGVVSPEAQRRYRLPDGISGVLIENIDIGSEAAAKGLRPGDVIVEVGGRVVHTPRDVSAAITEARAAKREAILLLIKSRDAQRFVALNLK